MLKPRYQNPIPSKNFYFFWNRVLSKWSKKISNGVDLRHKKILQKKSSSFKNSNLKNSCVPVGLESIWWTKTYQTGVNDPRKCYFKSQENTIIARTRFFTFTKHVFKMESKAPFHNGYFDWTYHPSKHTIIKKIFEYFKRVN